MKVIIEVIPHNQQRYPTVGDWQYFENQISDGRLLDLAPEEVLIVRISDTGYPKYNLALMVHELIEATLCKIHGVTEQQVDDWDLAHLESDDPGSVWGCPYRNEHNIATNAERTLIDDLNLTLGYEVAIKDLDK